MVGGDSGRATPFLRRHRPSAIPNHQPRRNATYHSREAVQTTEASSLADFATAPGWAQNGMPNWVDQTKPTDQDGDSTGCGMAFISWLISMGHPLSRIAPEL